MSLSSERPGLHTAMGYGTKSQLYAAIQVLKGGMCLSTLKSNTRNLNDIKPGPRENGGPVGPRVPREQREMSSGQSPWPAARESVMLLWTEPRPER